MGPVSRFSRCSHLSASVLENSNQFAVAARDLRDGGFTCDLLRPKVDQRVPENRTANGKTDKPLNAGCDSQPLAHFLLVLAAAQNNAADVFPPATARDGHNVLAVLVAVEPLDLPDIRFNPCVLKLQNGLGHQCGTEVQIVGFLVAFEVVELCLLRR